MRALPDISDEWRSGARRVRRRPPPAGGGAQDLPRVRDRLRPVRRLGDRARAVPDRDRRQAAAPLRRRPVRAGSGAVDGGAQARRAARAVPRPGGAGDRDENPAELLGAPKRAHRLPHVLKPGEVAILLDRIPATTPLELRDRALFELAYGSGLRAEELVTLDVDSLDFDQESVRVEGKGNKTRIVPVGEHALRALERYLARGRPALGGIPAARAARPATRSGRCSSRGRAAVSAPRTSDAGFAPGPARRAPSRRPSPRSIPTRCATHSRPICSRAGPICGRFRSFSAMPRSLRPRSTLG